MQVPAPFEYTRATSVAEAIGLLERLGDEARLIAGGHSLLPMMKLRLANLEYVIDINDLHDELGYVRVGTGEVRIGAMTRHRELLESPELAAHFPIFADAERIIADPSSATAARSEAPLPGRPRRGPDRGLHHRRRPLRDPRVGRGAGGLDGRLLPRPLRDGGGARRDPDRGPDPAAAARLERLRHGRTPGRRLGGHLGGCRGVDGRRGDRRRAGRPGRGRPNAAGMPGHLRGAERPGALGGALRQGRIDRRRELLPGDRPGGRPTTSATSPTS